jgi:acetylglutamate kinase
MEPVVVKISGGLTDDPESIDLLANFVRSASEKHIPVVLVHGGGKQINALCQQLGVDILQLEGRRVTTPETLDVLLYTVGGLVNRSLVSDLRCRGISAVGLTGADGELTTARRREPIRIGENLVDFQLVGELENVDPKLIYELLKSGYLPVVACLTWSKDYGLLNINADTFAIALAVSLSSTELVMLMEPEAVLNEDKEPISRMSVSQYAMGVRDGWIRDGMIPKLQTGFQAIKHGVNTVRLTNARGLSSGGGTLLYQGGDQTS